MDGDDHNADFDDSADLYGEHERSAVAAESDHESRGSSNGRQMAMLSKLTSAISLKQKLIDELSAKQHNAKRATERYDEQLSSLEQSIRKMQTRRNQKLEKLDEEMRQVRDKYEKRLSAMSNELRQLVSASKLHVVTVRSQHTDQKQIDSLQRQVAELNKMKAQLMTRIQSEETRRSHQVELLRTEVVDDCSDVAVDGADEDLTTNDVQHSMACNVRKPSDKELHIPAVRKRKERFLEQFLVSQKKLLLEEYLQGALSEARRDLTRLRADVGISRRHREHAHSVDDASATKSATNCARQVKQSNEQTRGPYW